jgi:hypothetical protein
MQDISRPSLFTRGTIILIVLVQIVLGVIFILSPGTFPAFLGLPPAPSWTDWMFAQFWARALGFDFGMLIALRDIRRHAPWLAAMIGVQAIDWIATILAVETGKVTLAQVSTAAFLPVLFMAVLALELRRQRASLRVGMAR